MLLYSCQRQTRTERTGDFYDNENKKEPRHRRRNNLVRSAPFLIVMESAPENEHITPSIPETASAVKVDSPVKDMAQPENTKLVDNINSSNGLTSQPEIEIDDFTENVDIELPDTEQNDPPEPPKIEDEMPPTITVSERQPTLTNRSNLTSQQHQTLPSMEIPKTA